MDVLSSDTWTLDPSGFPHAGTFGQKAEYLLRYATLAPSGHNTQPWLFSIREDAIDIFADRRRALPVVDPYDRELVISCGAAIGMLDIAARQFGFMSSVSLSPDPNEPDLLARVDLRIVNEPVGSWSRLFEAIKRRRTTRAAFLPERPPEALVHSCKDRAAEYGIDFAVFSNEAERRNIAKLVTEGDQIQFENPAFRRELAAWVHSTRLGSRDGMSGTGFGMPDILAPVARFVIRTFDLGSGVAAGDEKKIMSGTPMLGVLSSTTDNHDDWTNTGRALSGILLELTAEGFTASYLNQPIETEELRPKLAKTARITGFPQILLRLGKTKTLPQPTVRRDISEVMRPL